MSSIVRWHQVRQNLVKEGVAITVYKIYYYLFGYAFDVQHGTDTTSPATEETVNADGSPRGDRTAAFPCHPLVLKEALRCLAITEDDTFLDIGCGKGRALVVASAFPFRRLVGVDLMRSHIRIAERNLRRVKPERVQLIHGDALAVGYPADASICFLFKPFPEEIILQCLGRVGSSLRAIILMGTEEITEIDGYTISYRYVHRPSARFSYTIFEKRSSERSAKAAGVQTKERWVSGHAA